MFNIFGKNKKPEKLFFKTDIHCHIIPGVDDGSPDVATSLELAERMSSWGLERIIATPHVTKSTFENTPDILDPALDDLATAMMKKGMKTEISRSAEYRLDEFFLQQLRSGLITPYPNNYLLVENPYFDEPARLDNLLFDLKIQGYELILAHPERYGYYSVYRRHRYDELHNSGVLFQVNLLSLAGYYGKQEKKTAEMLLEKGYIDFLGTDLHHHRHADSIEAYLSTKQYKKLAAHLKVMNDKV